MGTANRQVGRENHPSSLRTFPLRAQRQDAAGKGGLMSRWKRERVSVDLLLCLLGTVSLFSSCYGLHAGHKEGLAGDVAVARTLEQAVSGASG